MSIGLLPNFFFIGSPEAQAFREVRVRFLLPASYLSAAPHAEPHADGVSSGLSAAPHAEPHADGVSSGLSAAPHAVPHAAGVSSGFPAAPHAVPHADAGASSIFLLHPNRFKSDIFCSSFFCRQTSSCLQFYCTAGNFLKKVRTNLLLSYLFITPGFNWHVTFKSDIIFPAKLLR